ncbi:MAG: PAS domain S-box protein, partial [Verrucomicrobiota bacterium]
MTAAGRFAGALALVVGGAVLLGWALDVAALKSILPGWVSMKPNTAVAFILTGVALLLFRPPSSFGLHPSALVSLLSRFCSLFAGLIGLLSLSEYVFGWNPGFDQWLFCEPAGTVGTSYPGRMAPDTALCFMMLAAGLETARAMRHRSWMLGCSMVLGMLVLALSLAAMLNYFTPALGAFGWGGVTLMAVPTAIVFAVLGVALFLVVWPEIAAFCSLGRKTTAAYVLGLVLVVFIGLTSSLSVLWLDETAHRVSHAEQVLGAISDVMSEIAKAQSHTRGYVITGGERYLQAEQTASARCREALAGLRQLISDPAQKARVVRLEAQADELIGWFSQVIAARRAGSAAPLDMIDHGEDLMDSLRALVAQMDDAELLLLQQWQRDTSNVSRFTHLVIITGTAVGLIVFLSVLFGLNRAETEGRQAQATIAASEVRYRRLFEAARDGVLILDAETGMVVDVNPYLIELLGVTRAVFLGRKVWELGFFKDIVANEANFVELQQKQYIRYENMALEGHDGKLHEVEFVSNVYLVNNQKVIQCNIRDISERKKAEDQLAVLNQQNKLLLNSAAEGILGLDLQGNHTFVNPAATKILGYEAEELLGRHSHSLWHHTKPDGSHYPNEECPIYATYRDGTVHSSSTEVFWRKDGTSFPVEYSSTPLYEQEQLAGAVLTFADITERKALESHLAEALLQANAANNAKSEFLGIMTHELRNPLSGVLGFAQLLADTALDDEQKGYVRRISS